MNGRLLLITGALAAFTFSAVADDGGHKNNNGNNSGNSSFESSVIGSAPGLAIGGIASGGAPWVGSGEASVSSSGRIQVEVQGLLIAPTGPAAVAGTTAGITMVAATLVCGGSGGTPIVVPDINIMPAPLSLKGNAEIDQTVTLPTPCFAPVVLVRAFNPSAALGLQLGPFIAVTGIMPGVNPNPGQNNNENEDSHGNGKHGN